MGEGLYTSRRVAISGKEGSEPLFQMQQPTSTCSKGKGGKHNLYKVLWYWWTPYLFLCLFTKSTYLWNHIPLPVHVLVQEHACPQEDSHLSIRKSHIKETQTPYLGLLVTLIRKQTLLHYPDIPIQQQVLLPSPFPWLGYCPLRQHPLLLLLDMSLLSNRPCSLSGMDFFQTPLQLLLIVASSFLHPQIK